ncbi:hypothetical protein DRF65_11650 [Chryseobacterium pennae]|uniref:Uncharacterized protein n=1 Tax=Chryseobacterium pennae TaxID=2258962 RepID=A0A3D9C9C2_9FLAO|nr:hypothetical protein [Chryseobacterium pennae]REC62359.1 hypothetical protein DRF65_11650 [Chryseobacterium pennae]
MKRLNQHKTASAFGNTSILSLGMLIVTFFGIIKSPHFLVGVFCLLLSYISSIVAIILQRRNPLWWIILFINIGITLILWVLSNLIPPL